MPINFETDRINKIIITTCRDVVSIQDFFSHQRENGVDDTLFGFDEIFDARKADFSEFNHLALQSIAQVTSKLPAVDAGARIAVIVDSGNAKAILELYQMIESVINGSGREMKVFQNVNDAKSWIFERRSCV